MEFWGKIWGEIWVGGIGGLGVGGLGGGTRGAVGGGVVFGVVGRGCGACGVQEDVLETGLFGAHGVRWREGGRGVGEFSVVDGIWGAVLRGFYAGRAYVHGHICVWMLRGLGFGVID